MAKKKPKRRRAKNAAKGDETYPCEHLGSGSLLAAALSVSKLDLPRSRVFGNRGRRGGGVGSCVRWRGWMEIFGASSGRLDAKLSHILRERILESKDYFSGENVDLC
ncbi:MAG: hypothetical protein WA733_11730 [Methylocystis sp.]